MTEKECYAVLEIRAGSDIETVKKSYRRLAFALHPDLNPTLPNAARRFQQINEAYVTLIHIQEEKGYTKKQSPQNEKKSQQAENSETRERVKREAEKAYAKAKKEQGREQKETPQRSSSRTSTKPKKSQAATGASSHGNSRKTATSSSQKVHEEDKGQVINDILSDPFAKRVFEDIYKRIHDVAHEKILRPAAEVVLGTKERHKGDSSNSSILTRLKGWAMRQIDDEQVLHLPRERIIPGARVRMDIQHGITAEAQTIEVTLPLDFSPGKTMRLKGLGKRVGSLSGDLYIRIEPN